MERLVREAEYSKDPFLRHFDIAIDTEMPEVDARVIGSPKILYGGNQQYVLAVSVCLFVFILSLTLCLCLVVSLSLSLAFPLSLSLSNLSLPPL